MAVGRLALLALAVCGVPSLAHAQDGLVVQPAVPQGFDRGRNVSVRSRPRPSYAPLGVHVGGLMMFPQLRTSAGATSNAYLTQRNQVGAAFATLEPSIRVASLWSRHSLRLDAASLLRSYVGQPRRRERTWQINGRGQVELGRAVAITGEASALQGAENQFSGEIEPTVAALSRFRRVSAALRGEYTSGRMRTFIMADRAQFRFAPIRLADGAIRGQADRDRAVSRVIGQVEYARTPSVSLFAQLALADTAFRRTGAMLGSRAIRAIGGVNADIAGRARGTIAIGYSIRDYRAVGFSAVGGPVVEGQGELFPTERLTITAAVRRTIEDATSVNTAPQPFWDNRLSLGGDYELLGNLILSASGEYALQTAIRSDRRSVTYRLATDARYLLSRRATLTGGVSFTERRSRDFRPDSGAGEGRVEAGLTYHL